MTKHIEKELKRIRQMLEVIALSLVAQVDNLDKCCELEEMFVKIVAGWYGKDV